MGYLTMVIFFATLTEEYIFFAVMFLILAVCLAAAAAVKIKKKRRSGRIFAVSAAVCLLFTGMNCYELIELSKIPPYIDRRYSEKLIDLTGMDYNEAKAEYSQYFNMTVAKEIYSSEYPAGAVIEHTPRAGSIIMMGNSEGNASEVRCTVSRGPQMITVPNTYTLDIDTACQMIEGVGLTYSFTNEYSETVPKGCVISTNPERNEIIERGSTVNIVVSKGSEEISAEPGEE